MTMTTHGARDVARDFFARFTAGDVSGALDLLDGDATWWLLGRPDSPPASGLYTKDGITELLDRLKSRGGRLRVTVRHAVAEDDWVALEIESRGELEDGRTHRHRYHTLMRISGGKIYEVREYNDNQNAFAVWLQS
jgi:uncharacterized protein